ncbi:hypothetical protein [Moorena sp. SIO3A2]|uniref:hypothetical protein n=1 Tax=Moorena sp. SIO3A2 TaxID=2607841 RepID=UPI0013B9EE07|nr:hypothetical protein [Moorena sp. SIO3A2]NER87703.1 hypothetical protein [Moorena sp. SIO3A2]
MTGCFHFPNCPEVHSILLPLLPTPYSLLPTPYSLLPTPYSLLPTPYSLLPTPYSLLPKTEDFVAHPIDNCYSR